MALRRPGCSPRPAGFTLLETLLSLAIALVVVALVYSVYHTVTQTLEGQQSRETGPERTAEVLQQISDDLTRMFMPEGDETCRLRMAENDDAPATGRRFFTVAAASPHGLLHCKLLSSGDKTTRPDSRAAARGEARPVRPTGGGWQIEPMCRLPRSTSPRP